MHSAKSGETGRLRIALVAPPSEAVPPAKYGGTERIVHELAVELHRRGHHVTVFASGDSSVPGELVAVAPAALRPLAQDDDADGWMLATISEVLRRADDFDIIHSHLDWAGILLAHASMLDFMFYTGQQFPKEYQGGAFLAWHGSWNRAKRQGYQIAFVPFAKGKPTG